MKKIKLLPMILLFSLALSVFAPCARAAQAPALNGRNIVLVDLNTGRVIYSKDPDSVVTPVVPTAAPGTTTDSNQASNASCSSPALVQ